MSGDNKDIKRPDSLQILVTLLEELKLEELKLDQREEFINREAFINSISDARVSQRRVVWPPEPSLSPPDLIASINLSFSSTESNNLSATFERERDIIISWRNKN